MTTLSTHDTKRSEDARLRLAVLSELAADVGDEFAQTLLIGLRPGQLVPVPA